MITSANSVSNRFAEGVELGDPARLEGGARRARGLALTSAPVAALLALPLVFLVIEAIGSGTNTIAHLMWRRLTAELVWNTVRLTVVVTLGCAVIGTAGAYLVERTDLPGRRIWAVLLVIPLAIPDFIVSFGWSSITTFISGFRGAAIIMMLAVYPLVYLPVAASLRGADPDQEDIARSLGAGRVRTFWRITIGQSRNAILGGCVLVALVMLAEYGAFEIVGYQTFTTEIFSEFNIGFDTASACALSIVLIIAGALVLFVDAVARGRGSTVRIGSGVTRRRPRVALGRATILVELGLVAFVGAALGVPIGSSVYWIFAGGAGGLSGVSMASAALHSALYGACAAALATVMAIPIALLAVRHRGRAASLLEHSTFVVLAMPGLVIALAFAYFSERYAGGFLYQSAPLLVLAYAILFFPLALVGVRASVAQAPVALEEIAASLGMRRFTVLRRVTFPIVAPGLGAAFCLVFLSTVTELTATLILVPNGVQTLATQFWAYQQNLSYGQAAPFALVIMGIAAVPSYLLGRFFDRLPSRAGRS